MSLWPINGRYPFTQFAIQAKLIVQINFQTENMPEHIEDLQQRYAGLQKRMELVRSYL